MHFIPAYITGLFDSEVVATHSPFNDKRLNYIYDWDACIRTLVLFLVDEVRSFSMQDNELIFYSL